MPSPFSPFHHHRSEASPPATPKPESRASETAWGYRGPETPPETTTLLESRQPHTTDHFILPISSPLFHQILSFIFHPTKTTASSRDCAREGGWRWGSADGCEIINLTFVRRPPPPPLLTIRPSLFPILLASRKFPIQSPLFFFLRASRAPSHHLCECPIFGPFSLTALAVDLSITPDFHQPAPFSQSDCKLSS